MTDLVLGGDINSQFTFGKPEDYATSVEQARLEQEQMAGYPLVVKHMRQTHTLDDQGRDVYEVFATFAPAPVQVLPPGDATQV